MNSINLNAFQRYHSYQALCDLAPFLVTSQRGLRMRVTVRFSSTPGAAQVALTEARELAAAGWRGKLARGPVVITAYGSPWFLVELVE